MSATGQGSGTQGDQRHHTRTPLHPESQDPSPAKTDLLDIMSIIKQPDTPANTRKYREPRTAILSVAALIIAPITAGKADGEADCRR